MKHPGYIIHSDLKDSILALADDQAGRLLKGIMMYSDSEPDFSQDPVLNIMWLLVKPRLDADIDGYERKCAARAESGRRGGLARAEAVKQNEANQAIATFATGSKQTKPIQLNTTQYNSIQLNTIESNATAVEKKDKPVKHKHGAYQNVLLTDDELEKLKAELPDCDARIERLSEYMASTGKSYKSHLATIRAWARKDGAAAQGAQRTVDADELAAIRELMGD